MNYKHFSDIYTNEKEFQREKLQFLFDKSFRDKDETLLRNQYITLRQLEFLDDLTFEPECVELSSLAESVTVACDILSCESGVNFIYFDDSPCFVNGDSRLITKALLNLLSNAYLYGKENLITVKTITSGNCCGIEVVSGGTFSENHKTGNGLSFVRKICNKMNGNFFIEQTISHTKSIMLFPKDDSYKCKFQENDDILSLVYNRLSPVCIEMFGMEYH